MTTENPIVLLLEDCPVTALLVERTVMHEIPQCRLLWARSVEEATLRSEGLDVALFVVDIGLPDGSGLDFLWKVSSLHPRARAIVITATPLPEHQMHSVALGVLHFLEKPLKLPILLSHLRQALDSEHMTGPNRDFRASLENVTPVDIVQLKCLAKATTVMEFHADGQVGRMRFEDGEVFDAECGKLRGVDALFEMLGWKCGQIAEQPSVGFFERTIDCPWQGLLMDAAQRIDESRAAAAG